MRVAVRHLLVGILVAGCAFMILDTFQMLPRERMLQRQNRELRAELDELNLRMDRAQTVMADIAARDNNFYRVMLQADTISDALRYAGLDRKASARRISSMADNALVEALDNKMELLEREIYVQSRSFDELRALASQQSERLRCIPAIQPVSQLSLKQMASGYGRRVDPVYGTAKFHEGMDFSANPGTPVYATGDARVVWAGWHSGFGNLVELDHGFNYLTRYAHLSKIDVCQGQTVKRGDKVGEVGNTGKSTGPHLHYEVRYKGQPQNPVNYYFYDLTPEQYDEMIRMAENAGHVMD